MKRSGTAVAVALALMAGVGRAAAGEAVAPNRTYVRASYGTYARSVPRGATGDAGVTRIYFTQESGKPDLIGYTFDWYSPDLQLWGSHQVVRVGGWHPGAEASAAAVELAFYREGRLVKSYSALDLAGDPRNVRRVGTNYRVVDRIIGIRDVGSADYLFEAALHDGRVLMFDLQTGEIIPRLDYARAMEREFWSIRSMARPAGVPDARAIELYDYLRGPLTAEAERLLADRGRDPEATRESFRALGRTARARILGTLGPVAGPRYVATSYWLKELERGNAIRFHDRGYSSTSF